MSLKSLIDFDKKVLKKSNYFLIGIDEVGRGALAGPVIACAFAWKNNKFPRIYKPIENLNDSKQLTKDERRSIYSELINCGHYGLGYASVEEIDKFNVLNATYLAMKRAFETLIETTNIHLQTFTLIDGNKFNPYINSLQIPVVKGDAQSSLIAAASVIAKVTRDNLMTEYSTKKQYCNYGFNENVGYGTLKHRTAIRNYGPTNIHRKLFIRKSLSNSRLTNTH